MADSEHSLDNYKSLKISIRAITKNLELLRFIPDGIKTKKMCKNALKKLPFLIRYVPNKFKTQ